MMGYFYNNMMGGLGFFGFFLMIIFWALVIWGILSFFRCTSGSCMGGHNHNSGLENGKKEKSPLDILKERYAKGEIDKKEFDQKKKDLIQ